MSKPMINNFDLCRLKTTIVLMGLFLIIGGIFIVCNFFETLIFALTFSRDKFNKFIGSRITTYGINLSQK